MGKVKIITLNNVDRAEPDECYRIDDPHHAISFFANLQHNAEFDGREVITLKTVSEKEWKKIEKRGEELS